jgi:hypothetical protein
VRDFRAVWLESEADPPAFAKARKRVKHTVVEGEETGKAESVSTQEPEISEKAETVRDAQLMLPPKKRKRVSTVSESQRESSDKAEAQSESSDKIDANEKTPAEESSVNGENTDSTQSAKDESLSNEDEELADELNSFMKDEVLLKEAAKYGQFCYFM